MSSLAFFVVSLIIIYPIIYFTMLGDFSRLGKNILMTLSALTAAIGLVIVSFVPLWQAYLVVILTALVFGYLLEIKGAKLNGFSEKQLPIYSMENGATQTNTSEEDSGLKQFETEFAERTMIEHYSHFDTKNQQRLDGGVIPLQEEDISFLKERNGIQKDHVIPVEVDSKSPGFLSEIEKLIFNEQEEMQTIDILETKI